MSALPDDDDDYRLLALFVIFFYMGKYCASRHLHRFLYDIRMARHSMYRPATAAVAKLI